MLVPPEYKLERYRYTYLLADDSIDDYDDHCDIIRKNIDV
jgi:hypothetical protein